MNITVDDSRESAVSQLALLHRISSIVSSDLSLHKMLDELIELVSGVTNCDAAVLILDGSAEPGNRSTHDAVTAVGLGHFGRIRHRFA